MYKNLHRHLYTYIQTFKFLFVYICTYIFALCEADAVELSKADASPTHTANGATLDAGNP